MLKILYVSNNTGFCRFYRCQSPAQYLVENNLATIQFVDPVDQLLLNRVCSWADVIVFQHGVSSKYISILCNFIKEHQLPQLVICDYDDNLHESNPTNVGAYHYWGTQEIYSKDGKPIWKDGYQKFNIKANIDRIIKLDQANTDCDLITTTTTELAEAFTKVNQNIEVLPNFLNPSIMPICKNPFKSDKIRILWQGGDSHYADLALVMPALRKIKEIYQNRVEFVLWGISYKSLGKDIDATFIPWSEPELFFPKFSEQKFDIGIIPIEDNKFNRGKSNIKWMEYSYYNIPSVVQNNLPYKQHIEHMKTGLVFDTNQELFDNLTELINDPILRITIAKNAKDKVLKDYNLQTKYNLWNEVYLKHLEKKIKSYSS